MSLKLLTSIRFQKNLRTSVTERTNIRQFCLCRRLDSCLCDVLLILMLSPLTFADKLLLMSPSNGGLFIQIQQKKQLLYIVTA